MARKKDVDVTLDYCDAVIEQVLSYQTITWDELFEVAERWCKKDYEYHFEFANKHGLIPIAVLICALIYVDHPLVVTNQGNLRFGLQRLSAEVIMVQLKKIDVAIPVRVGNYIHIQEVQTI